MEDTAPLLISGATTDADHYWDITAAAEGRHPGHWDTSKYYLNPSEANRTEFQDAYIHVGGIQINKVGGNFNLILANNSGVQHHFEIHECIIRITDPVVCNVTTVGTATGSTIKMWNCLLHQTSGTKKDGFQCDWTANYWTLDFWNCTFVGFLYGLNKNPGGHQQVIRAVNCLFRSCTYPCDHSDTNKYAAGTDYNACDNASMNYHVDGDGNIHDRVSQTFTFVGEGSENWHLAVGDAGAKDYGKTDPGSGKFSDDIDGETRSGSWDIGMDEYILATLKTLAGSVAAISSVNAVRLKRTRELKGAVSAIASLTGKFWGNLVNLVGAIHAVSSASAVRLKRQRQVKGAISAVSSFTGTFPTLCANVWECITYIYRKFERRC